MTDEEIFRTKCASHLPLWIIPEGDRFLIGMWHPPLGYRLSVAEAHIIPWLRNPQWPPLIQRDHPFIRSFYEPPKRGLIEDLEIDI